MNKYSERIVICVCTRGRPIMLRNCLEQLSSQLVPESKYVDIVVVENDIDSKCKDIVDDINKYSMYHIFYVHQPILGISHARNSALRVAGYKKADWVVFIDDDNIVGGNNWLLHLENLIDKTDSDIIQGSVIHIWPKGTPLWIKKGQMTERKSKEFIKTARTPNVAINARVLLDEEAIFNPKFALTGGEDSEFFERLIKKGATVTYYKSLIAFEIVSEDRATVYWNLRSAFRIGYARQASIVGKSGFLVSLANGATYFLKKMSVGLAKAIVSPVVMIIYPEVGKYTLMSAGRNISKALGYIYGLFGGKFEHYRNVTGH